MNLDRNFTEYLKKRVNNSMFFNECSSFEICNIIKEFACEKASDISVKVLKRAAANISGHLSGLFNKFIELGTFPDMLKIRSESVV